MQVTPRDHPPPEAAALSQPEDVATLVSISPFEEDHAFLQNIFDHSQWQFHAVRCAREALAVARKKLVAVVICEEHLPDGNWRGMLAELTSLPHAPLLIVTARLADDRLWAEVLNLGAYDLLMKPFDRIEVVRVVNLAWRHWKDSRNRAQAAGRVRRAIA